jgi:hypothetical protein
VYKRQGQRATARYCSGRCRKRAADARARGAEPVSAPVLRLAMPDAEPVERSGIGATMIARYGQDVTETPDGALAVRLASDIDQLSPGAPGMAALVRELRGLLADLEAKAAPAKANPLTLLRARHAERASG